MSPEQATSLAQFEFVSLFITKTIFELLATEVQTIPRPPVVNIGMEVGASAQLSQDGTRALVKLDTKFTPDQQWQPYRIEVSLGAVFSSHKAAVGDELRTFCQIAAPAILFPYIRETVHRLTMDAPYGQVRLNPMNISNLLNQSEWHVAQATSPTPGASTEPPPPSGQ